MTQNVNLNVVCKCVCYMNDQHEELGYINTIYQVKIAWKKASWVVKNNPGTIYPWESAHAWAKDRTWVYMWHIRVLCVPALTHCSYALLHSHGYEALSFKMPVGGCCNICHPSETHRKIKSCEISFIEILRNLVRWNHVSPVPPWSCDTGIDTGRISFPGVAFQIGRKIPGRHLWIFGY